MGDEELFLEMERVVLRDKESALRPSQREGEEQRDEWTEHLLALQARRDGNMVSHSAWKGETLFMASNSVEHTLAAP